MKDLTPKSLERYGKPPFEAKSYRHPDDVREDQQRSHKRWGYVKLLFGIMIFMGIIYLATWHHPDDQVREGLREDVQEWMRDE